MAGRSVRFAPRGGEAAGIPWWSGFRHGDFGGLLEVLAPEVVLRFDPGTGPLAPYEMTGA